MERIRTNLRDYTRPTGRCHPVAGQPDLAVRVAFKASTAPPIAVLAVTRQDATYLELRRVVEDGDWNLYTRRPLTLQRTKSTAGAKSFLGRQPIPVLILDGDAVEGSWQEMARYSALQPSPSALIVTSRFADERLWAEAFDLGAYDVLAKPFVPDQVLRTVGLAWLYWRDREHLRSASRSTAAALRAAG